MLKRNTGSFFMDLFEWGFIGWKFVVIWDTAALSGESDRMGLKLCLDLSSVSFTCSAVRTGMNEQ